MARAPRSGITFVTIDGSPYDLASDMTYTLNNLTRETLIGQDDVHGFSEKPVAGKIEFTVRDATGLSVSGFQDMTSVNIAVKLSNGKQILGTGMWTVDVQSVTAEDATIKLSFEGLSVTEIGA